MQFPKNLFRHALLLFINQDKTAAQDHRILIEIYGDVVPSIKKYEYYFCQFKSDDFNINGKGKCKFASIIG